MLMKADYLEKFKKRVLTYMMNGYVIGDNLILTSDNMGHGINSQMITEMIDHIIGPRVFANS